MNQVSSSKKGNLWILGGWLRPTCGITHLEADSSHGFNLEVRRTSMLQRGHLGYFEAYDRMETELDCFQGFVEEDGMEYGGCNHDELQPIGQFVKMNILLRNCRGALNADFKRRIFEMTINYHPSIMVVMETRVGGDRAVRIIKDLLFDGSIATNTTGYAGGLWLLW